MNQKGITVVEFGVVIILLSIIAIILTPTILKLIEKSKEKLYKNQIQIIQSAAERWSADNIEKIIDKKCFCKDAKDLIKEGYIQNNTNLKGFIKITYEYDHNQYTYKYVKSCKCD